MSLEGKFKSLFFLFNFISFMGLGYLNATDFVKRPPFSKRFLIPPPPRIEYFTFGYSESLSDFLWIRWIQDVSICGKKRITRSELKKWIIENRKSETLQGEESFSPFFALNQKGKKRNVSSLVSDALSENEKNTICFMGWTYHMLDAITKLAPKYYIVYSIGASSLSVLGDDPWGAKIIFDRGVKNFPKDWRILYRAAYHYLYELFDTNRASWLLKKAGENGAPEWVFSLAKKLKTNEGKLRLATIVLEDFKRNLKNEKQREKVHNKINWIRKQILEERNKNSIMESEETYMNQ